MSFSFDAEMTVCVQRIRTRRGRKEKGRGVREMEGGREGGMDGGRRSAVMITVRAGNMTATHTHAHAHSHTHTYTPLRVETPIHC